MPSPPPKEETKQWRCDVCKHALFEDFDEAVRHEELCQQQQQHQQRQHGGRGLNFDEDEKDVDEHVDDEMDQHHQKHKEDHALPEVCSTSSSNSKSKKDVHPFFSSQAKSKTNAATIQGCSQEKKQLNVGAFFLPKGSQDSSDNTSTKSAVAAAAGTNMNPKKKRGRPKKTAATTTGEKSQSTKIKKEPTSNSSGSGAKITPPPSAATSATSKLNTSDPKLASIFQNKSMKQIMAEQKLAEFQAKREAERQRERERQAKRALLFNSSSSTNNNGSIDSSSGDGCAGIKRKASTTNSSVTTKLLPIAPRFPVPNHVLGVTTDNGNRPATTIKGKTTEIRLDEFWKSSTSPPLTSSSEMCHIQDGTESMSMLIPSLSKLDVTTTTATMIQQALSHTLVPPGQQALSDALVPPGPTLTTRSLFTNIENEISQKGWNDKYGMDHGVVGSDAQQVYQKLVEFINYWKSARNDVLQRMAERQRKFQASNGTLANNKKGKSSKKKKTTSKKKGSNYGYGSNDFIVDDDEDYELEEDDELSKLCMLIGPSSSGKTSLIHHVAGRQNCSVVEINTSTIRSGAALKRSIQEATQTTSSLGTFQTKKNSTTSFFAPRSKENIEQAENRTTKRRNDEESALFDSDDDDDDDDSVEQNRKQEELQKIALTIVLIDEVDILFDDDVGFWAALASVVKTTKCPIILTANQYPPNILSGSQFPCQFIEAKRPSPLECAQKVLQICQHERIQIQPHLRSEGPERTHEQLARIAEVCDCDLRRMMFELQLFAAPSSLSSGSRSTATNNAVMTNMSEQPDTPLDWRPMFLRLEPSTVPMDTYSIVRITGENLSSLLNAQSDTSVWVGDQRCQYKVVDDETILVLCPPIDDFQNDENSTYSSRLVRRIVPISLECPLLGQFKSSLPSQVVVRSKLIDDNDILETRRLSILYEYPEKSLPEPKTESEDEIDDFDCSDEDGQKPIPQILSTRKMASREEGEALWQTALSNCVPMDSSDSSDPIDRFPRRDDTMLDILENQSRYATNNSDAAVLEDELYGLPFLAGACQGYAFDYTEECVGKSQPDMLRMRDNSRPPQEEKLIELGWKDDSGFYGDPDWLVTYPASSHHRRQMNDVMCRLRGNVSVSGTLAMEPGKNRSSLEPNEIVTPEDLDRYALEACTLSIEDQFLPFPVQPVFELLPKLLRQANSSRDKSATTTAGSIDRRPIEKQQANCIDRDQTWASYILPPSGDRSHWSYGRFGSVRVTDLGEYELYGDGREVLELMPMFRRVGLLEQAAEHASLISEQQQEASCRRSNRRTTRGQTGGKTRHHYFDRLSLKLRRDQADISSTELGAQLAKAFMKY
mmetsp:Transcript_22575/g.53364  ORF Transcript_22575/g.53364 Transcript_22575/m.53364 type:complete len:1340 (+) Transcript_22575:309-4328(+)